MILDALSLDAYQSCRRRYLLHRDWRVRRIRPKSLFDRCLRAAVVDLASLVDPAVATTRAKASFMEAAASPGMDIARDADPYAIAKDHCAMLSTIIAALARSPIPLTKPMPQLRVAEGVYWRFASRIDEGGTLHRWITVDGWSTDDLARELHAWRTIGDITVADVPLTLHVIVIGRQRDGRRASPWARGFSNPNMNWNSGSRVHFATKLGKPLKGWRAKYLADDRRASVGDWVDTMFAEGVAQKLMLEVAVKQPPRAAIADTKSQIIAEAAAMAVLGESGARWPDVPMSRAACDDAIRPCPFQWICYGGDERVDIGGIGLYAAREIAPATTPSPLAVPV